MKRVWEKIKLMLIIFLFAYSAITLFGVASIIFLITLLPLYISYKKHRKIMGAMRNVNSLLFKIMIGEKLNSEDEKVLEDSNDVIWNAKSETRWMLMKDEVKAEREEIYDIFIGDIRNIRRFILSQKQNILEK